VRKNQMASVEEHYNDLLAACYTWMCGGYELALDLNRTFFRDHDIRPAHSAIAVDLGAGSGFQAIPLAEAGFHVIAIDVNRELLVELTDAAGRLPIRTIQDDLLRFGNYVSEEIEIIVCMGDTLTHLRSPAEVKQVIQKAYGALETEGLLILSFRDMTAELTGLDRFIPLRADSKRIFTDRNLKDYQTDVINMAISLFEKRASHAVHHKESLAKEKFDKADQ
jgi:2-polyprenyl-3-methyl-5-hydroxy-6-metoxy-1,4-benzoquinol methylase